MGPDSAPSCLLGSQLFYLGRPNKPQAKEGLWRLVPPDMNPLQTHSTVSLTTVDSQEQCATIGGIFEFVNALNNTDLAKRIVIPENGVALPVCVERKKLDRLAERLRKYQYSQVTL